MNKNIAGIEKVGSSLHVSWMRSRMCQSKCSNNPSSSDPENRQSVSSVDRDSGNRLGMPGWEGVLLNFRNLVVLYVVNSADETIQAAPTT